MSGRTGARESNWKLSRGVACRGALIWPEPWNRSKRRRLTVEFRLESERSRPLHTTSPIEA